MTHGDRGMMWFAFVLLVTGIVVLLWLLVAGRAEAGEGEPLPLRRLFDALHQVEASGQLKPPDGDGGRAIGPYQIWPIYWQSAIEHAPELGGTYQDCRRKDYAEWIILAHWLRFCPAALEAYDLRTLARIHKGGAPGRRNPKTLAYWHRVKAELDKAEP